jgi:hypothetical protein
MSIEDMYARRASSRSFNGYDKDYKPPKPKKTGFKVGDSVVVKGDDGKKYLKGKIISLANDMHIEGTVLLYSDYIRYPKGMKDVFIMGRDGKRNLNGMDFIVCKI